MVAGTPCGAVPCCPRQAQPTGYNMSVEKMARAFASFEESDEADARHDAAMSAEERLSILIELRDRRHPHAAEQRLARVSRVVELQQS
jgi:hypothetical protein